MPSFLDSIPFVPTALTIGVTYGGYFVASLASLIAMATTPNEQWPKDFAAITIFVTSGLHFGLTAFGFAAVPEYEAHTVWPEWAFLFADYFQAGALGAMITSYSLARDAASTPIVACVVTMLAQLLCFYKTYSLVTDVWAGRRDRMTGKRLSL